MGHDLAAALGRLLDDAVGRGIVGCALGVRRGDGPVLALARGLADRGKGIALEPGARFRIASVTKSFVAALLLQLIEEGRLSLTDVLARWLPGRPFADRVTVRQLLTHTGGLPTYSLYRLDDFPPADARLPRTVYIDHAYERTPPTSAGGPFEYANLGSRIMGVMVERETGADLASEMRCRLLQPLGLADTLASGHDGRMPAGLARGYLHDGNEVRDVTDRVPWAYLWSGGDMISTVADLTTWMRALFTGRVLGAELTRALVADSIPGAFPGSCMSRHGLGVMVFERGGLTLHGYRGSTPGFVGIAGYEPASGLSVAIQTNSYAEDSHSVFRGHVERVAFTTLETALALA